MSQRIGRTDARRRKRNSRLLTLGWIAAITTLIIILLYKEKSDWLYVLATLGLTTLLIVVASSDLGEGRLVAEEASPGDDSASIANGITTAASHVTAPAPSDWRGPKNRKSRRK